MPRSHLFSFDPPTIQRLQALLERDSWEHNERVAANADPLVDGVEPNVLALSDVMTNIGKWDLPTFAVDRMADFVNYYAEFQDRINEMTRENIVVWLPQYERSFSEKSWVTRPTQIARFIGGEALLNDTACVTVNGMLWDFNRVLEKSCTLCFVSSSSHEGKEVIAHSSMHLLGQILELRFNCLLFGWRIDEYGQFYHDIANSEKVNGRYVAVDVTQDDLTTLQNIAEMVISKNFRFDRVTVKKADLAKTFKYSKNRVDQIDEDIPDDGYGTIYKCGVFIDLDPSGMPHVRESSILKEFEVIKNVPPKLLRIVGGTVRRVFGRSRPVEERKRKTYTAASPIDHLDEETGSGSTDHAEDENCTGVAKED